MPPGQHARLSASSAHRWIVCPGSVRLEEHVRALGKGGRREAASGLGRREHLERRISFLQRRGVRLDADVSRQLLINIFYPN
jgi:hypothetical protein